MAITNKGLRTIGIIKEHYGNQPFSLKDLNDKSQVKVHATSLTSLCKNGVLDKLNDSSPFIYQLVEGVQYESILKSEKESTIKGPKNSAAELVLLEKEIKNHWTLVEHWVNDDSYGTEPDSMVGIYCIKDENGVVIYVGKTERPFNYRWQEHKNNLLNNSHTSKKLQKYFNSINKNINKINFDILQSLPNDSKLIDIRERYWIRKYKETILNDLHPSFKLEGDLMNEEDKKYIRSKEEKEKEANPILVKKTANTIHEYLYSSIKLSDQDKATLIAGILIALENESFRNSYLSKTDEDYFIEDFMSAIKNSIKKFDGLKNGKDAVISTFDFIKHNQNFKTKIKVEENMVIALQYLTKIIELSIYALAKDFPGYDVLGDFYNEFTKYSGADQQSLGIALTPQHISRFMSELLEVKDSDILLDTCCGTATLLLTADMQTIVPNKIVGVEFNARMLSLAVANVMIRGLESHLLLGDSYSKEILDDVAAQKPTKLIINPPYSQDGYPELGFILRGLNSLQVGGLGVAIVPMSTAIKNDKLTKDLKKEILNKHQLLATFSMPDQLFYPIGVVTIIMLFKAHSTHTDPTFFGYIKDDGFEITRMNGRFDTKNIWPNIKEKILESYSNKIKSPQFSAVEKVSYDNEWCAEAYLETDYSNLNKKDFELFIKNYTIFNIKQGE